MSTPDSQLTALFIASFNADLAALNAAAQVGAPRPGTPADMIELLDDEGNFLDFIPASTEPRMAAIAYKLYGRGLNLGVRAGEEAAWAKLRHLIGAAPATDSREVGHHG
jgi:hypothetical protein